MSDRGANSQGQLEVKGGNGPEQIERALQALMEAAINEPERTLKRAQQSLARLGPKENDKTSQSFERRATAEQHLKAIERW